MLGLRSAARWERIGIGLLLGSFVVVSIEQTHSLSRSVWYALFPGSIAPNRVQLRVVTINCDLGSQSAAAEAVRFDPDIVLLQESPSEETVRALAQSLFGPAGDSVWSSDCSIVARGRLQLAIGDSRHFNQATLTLAAGPTIEIISLRLAPPLVRYDLWSPSCWTEHAAIRRQHRAETEALVKALSATPAERPILIGGDCNAPAGDGALQVWNDRLHDAFIQAGRGWGCTVLNLAPVLRFDQLWCSDKLRARGVWSVKTRHSDHRLVVGDFELAPL